MKDEIRYTMKEISMATGLSPSVLQSRRHRLGMESNRGGYTLSEVKQLIKRPPLKRGANPRKAEALKQMLKNDGAL